MDLKGNATYLQVCLIWKSFKSETFWLLFEVDCLFRSEDMGFFLFLWTPWFPENFGRSDVTEFFANTLSQIFQELQNVRCSKFDVWQYNVWEIFQITRFVKMVDWGLVSDAGVWGRVSDAQFYLDLAPVHHFDKKSWWKDSWYLILPNVKFWTFDLLQLFRCLEKGVGNEAYFMKYLPAVVNKIKHSERKVISYERPWNIMKYNFSLYFSTSKWFHFIFLYWWCHIVVSHIVQAAHQKQTWFPYDF